MEFTDANDFSELIGILKRAGRREVSYDRLAKRLGMNSPRVLAMVFKRQRAPSTGLVKSVCDYLKVTAKEREFIYWLAEKSRRELKGTPLASLDEKIDRFRAVRSMTVQPSTEIAGVKIEISPAAPETVRKKILEVLREIAFEAQPIQPSSPEGKAAE